jgi:hypothetical protein
MSNIWYEFDDDVQIREVIGMRCKNEGVFKKNWVIEFLIPGDATSNTWYTIIPVDSLEEGNKVIKALKEFCCSDYSRVLTSKDVEALK